MQAYFALVGAALLLAAAWLAMRRVQLLTGGVVVYGRLEAYVRSDIDDSSFYLPKVVFVDADGIEHRFTATAGHPTKKLPEGTRVRVRYLRRDPRRACIDNVLHMWGAVLGLTALGAAGIAALWVP